MSLQKAAFSAGCCFWGSTGSTLHQAALNVVQALGGWKDVSASVSSACFPEELLQTLQCFDDYKERDLQKHIQDMLHFCHRTEPSGARWQTRGHKWSRRTGCLPDLACRCVGFYLENGEKLDDALTQLKTQRKADANLVWRLRNFSRYAFQWQPPIRWQKGRQVDPLLRNLTTLGWQLPVDGITSPYLRQAFWERFRPLRHSLHTAGITGLALADGTEPDHWGLAGIASEILSHFKSVASQSTYNLQMQHGNDCALALFHGTCDFPHFPVFEAFPPVHGPAAEGLLMDFLGLSTAVENLCAEMGLALYSPARTFDCLWERQKMSMLRLWPVIDEEYLEWADILSSAYDASLHQRRFRMVDVGAGSHGIWATRAAKAFLRHAEPLLGCDLLMVEPFEAGDGSILRKHLDNNFPENRCNFTLVRDELRNSDHLKRLLADGDIWDLVDIDAQGVEHALLKDLAWWLRGRVRRLHVSTHHRWKHMDIFGWFKDAGWHVPVHYPTFSMVGLTGIGYSPLINADGHMTLVPPTLAWS